MRSKDNVVFAGCQSAKKPDKGFVCSHWIHTSDGSFARPQKDTAYSVFKKKFRITPAILRGLHRLEPEACGLENDGIILAVYEFCS